MAMKGTNMGKAQSAGRSAAKPAPKKPDEKAKPKLPMPAGPIGGAAGMMTPPMGMGAGAGGSDEVV